VLARRWHNASRGACGQLDHAHVPEFGQDILAHDALDAVASLAAAAAIVLEIVRHGTGDRVGAGAGQRETGRQPLLVSPPAPRCALRLREIQDAIAVGILQIIRQADLGFAIDAVLIAPARDPGAAGGASPVAEVESLLDHAPIGFCLHRHPQPRAARAQGCLPHRARHAFTSSDFAYFLSIIRDRIIPDVGGHSTRCPLKSLGFLVSAGVRGCPDYKLSRRKQGFESPRERQGSKKPSKSLNK
jgi:hypothetical protein